MDEKTIARFRSKVDRDGPVPTHCPELGNCWVWTAGINAWGYGQFHLDGQDIGAHRAAYTLMIDDIPEGLFVLHKCDRTTCVRPSHLFIGNDADNAADRVRKGRNRGGVGARNANAKFTDADVIDVRAAHAAGTRPMVLARQYGVGRKTISRIVRRISWRHL